MKYNAQNLPLICMMTNSTCYKGTGTMAVKGVLWHSTGANNPNLKRYVQPDDDAADRAKLLETIGKNTNGNDWNHIYKMAGLNAWIGKLANGTVAAIQTMPWNYRPWGCGSGDKGSCNYGWIQFEICEDGLTDAAYFNKVYQEACELTAHLCTLYGIDPHGTAKLNGITVPTILCHHDSYKLGVGGGHVDIDHWFPKFGKSMETVRDDVAALMSSAGVATANEPITYETNFKTLVVVDGDDVLNCRKGAGTEYGVVKSYTNGTVLTITKVTDGWGYTGEGWVSLLYTIAINEEDWIDMTTTEVKTMIQDTVGNAVQEAVANANPRYTKLDDVPSWYHDTVEKLIERGAIKGVDDAGTLNLSADLCATLTVLDRLGKLD